MLWLWFVADLYRSRLVVVGNVPLLNEDTRRAVSRRSHDVVIVEPDVAQVHRQLSIPVLLAVLVTQTQMPLADGCRGITSVLERVGNRELLRSDNHPRIASCDVRPRMAESILASQETVSGWRTRGSNRVDIRKAYAALCQRIDIRRLHPCSTKALQVAIAQVVGINENHIRLLAILNSRISLRRLSRRGNNRQHGRSHCPKVNNTFHCCKDTNKRVKYQIYLSISERKYLRP